MYYLLYVVGKKPKRTLDGNDLSRRDGITQEVQAFRNVAGSQLVDALIHVCSVHPCITHFVGT